MFVSLRIHPVCKLSCAFLKKHIIVFTCSYPLPVSFPCVSLSFFPLSNLLSVSSALKSSAPLWIVLPPASILRLLLEKMSTRWQHFSFTPLVTMVTASWEVIPGLIVNASRKRHRTSTNFLSLYSLMFFSKLHFISYLRLFTPVLFQGKSFSFLSTDTWRYSTVVIVRAIF